MTRTITNYQPIHQFGVQCGYLQTIQTTGFKAVEIEYHLDKEYRKQGIMSNYLPIYLADLEVKGFGNVTAHVKKNNWVSKNLLKRNKFFKFSEVRDVEIFVKTKKD
jgi:RimJ/RimL family protein N-acetyltransferase